MQDKAVAEQHLKNIKVYVSRFFKKYVNFQVECTKNLS